MKLPSKATLVMSMLAFLLMCFSSSVSAIYYNYTTWNTGYSNAYGVDGWVGSDNIDRLIFYNNSFGSSSAHVYQVSTLGNPNLHPDNPDATGPIAPRTFVHEYTFNLHNNNYSHENEFYVDSDNGYFYLGATNGIEQYDFSGNYITTLGTPSPNEGGYSTQSLAYNESTNDWYAATIGFDSTADVYMLDGDNLAMGWNFLFATPVSNHHDGMEVLSNGNLLLADYNGTINEYTVGGTFVTTHTHDPFPIELEGMGYGALGHYWGGSHQGIVFEFGGGSLVEVPEPRPLLLIALGLLAMSLVTSKGLFRQKA